MVINVVYHSMSGNTEKVASVIAGECNTFAREVKKEGFDFSKKIDLLFIGSGVYAGKSSKKIRNFISKLDSKNIMNVAVFVTSGGQAKVASKLVSMLKNNGFNVFEEVYACKGKSMLLFNRKHPDEKELKDAKEFARNIAKTVRLELKEGK